MIKQIGAKVYYYNITGEVLKIIGDMQGFVTETTFDEDYEMNPELKEKEKSTIGVLQFDYGVYFELSKNSTGVTIDLETLKPVFTYDDLPLQAYPDYSIEDDEMNNLYIQIESRDKTIALLTYELMILQEPIATMFIDGVSEKFNSIKLWYNRKYWDDEMVLNVVIKGYITEEESNKILDK